MSAQDNLNPQQFYHGTRTKFAPGDLLTPQGAEKASGMSHADVGDSDEEPGQHVYISPGPRMAVENFAYSATGYPAAPRVYQVEPLGRTEDDPYAGFGNLRTKAPVKVVREVAHDEADIGRMKWFD